MGRQMVIKYHPALLLSRFCKRAYGRHFLFLYRSMVMNCVLESFRQSSELMKKRLIVIFVDERRCAFLLRGHALLLLEKRRKALRLLWWTVFWWL